MARAIHMCGERKLTLAGCNDCCEELRYLLDQLRTDLETCCTDAQERLTNAETDLESLHDIVENLENFTVEVVDQLPQEGQENVMYLVPKTGSNVKDEYLWVNNAWELIGDTAVDLSAYVEKTTYTQDKATQAAKDTAQDNKITALEDCCDDVNAELDNKQDKLTAGTNVAIANNVISATDTKYTAGQNVAISGANVISATDTTYTAGTGLSLSGTTMNHSNSVTAQTTEELRKVKYDAQGHITGSSAVVKKDITDLGVPAQDTTYTAGTGINIDANKVISATGGGGGSTYRLTKTGSDIKLTEDGTVVSTVTDDNTTYSAGSGLSLSGTTFSAKTGYTTSGNNRKVQTDANGNLYVEQKDTTYSAGTNVQISSSNVISATDTKYTAGTYISINSSNQISVNLTKANILSILGYKETTIQMKDTDGNTTTKTILVKQ